MPSYFRSEIVIRGIPATDIFAFNQILGATIENEVVATLNRMRSVWDPDEEYALYSFVRQSQTFPDVLLRSRTSTEPPILGIELKGWYLLSKEGEPSFRYAVTPAVCADADLLVVFPWFLSEVTSGEPRLLPPFIEPARYAAELRNWHWTYGRGADVNPVVLAAATTPYPRKSDLISDRASRDQGGNFGRIARVSNLMDAFTAEVDRHLLAGIQADYWRKFLVLFKDAETSATINRALERLEVEIRRDRPNVDEHSFERLIDRLRPIAAALLE